MTNLSEYIQAGSLVDWAKASLDITKSNGDMDDDDIRRVICWIGEYSSDTVHVDGGKPILGQHGIGLMLVYRRLL